VTRQETVWIAQRGSYSRIYKRIPLTIISEATESEFLDARRE